MKNMWNNVQLSVEYTGRSLCRQGPTTKCSPFEKRGPDAKDEPHQCGRRCLYFTSEILQSHLQGVWTVRLYLDKLTGWQPLHGSLNFIWMLILALCWLYNAEFSHSHYQFNHRTNSLHHCCGLTIQNPPLQEITCISTLTTNKIWQVNILLQWDLKSGLWMPASPDDMVSLASSHGALKVWGPFAKPQKELLKGVKFQLISAPKS